MSERTRWDAIAEEIVGPTAEPGRSSQLVLVEGLPAVADKRFLKTTVVVTMDETSIGPVFELTMTAEMNDLTILGWGGDEVVRSPSVRGSFRVALSDRLRPGRDLMICMTHGGEEPLVFSAHVITIDVWSHERTAAVKFVGTQVSPT